MSREDGTAHLQPFLVNSQATEFIMSPEAILQACGVFDSWRREGFKQNRPGTLQFFDNTGTFLLDLPLSKRNGLYYCPHLCVIP